MRANYHGTKQQIERKYQQSLELAKENLRKKKEENYAIKNDIFQDYLKMNEENRTLLFKEFLKI